MIELKSVKEEEEDWRPMIVAELGQELELRRRIYIFGKHSA